MATLEAIAQRICTAEGLTFAGFVAAGAFKETFRATDAAGVPWALKVALPDRRSERADREIEVMLRCDHPNIGRLRKASTVIVAAMDYHYTIEEFLAGGTLSDRLRTGLLPADEIHRLAAALVSVIEYTEALRLVHRDIKPDNIMFREDRTTPVLVDFGIVRNLADTSLTPTFQMQGPGTPYFASPEQLHNEKHLIDWRADQFSLGVTLAMAGSGLHPFAEAGDTPGQTLDRVTRRTSASTRFQDWARGSTLTPLVRMVAPWPVQRFRLPTELAAAWSAVPAGKS